MVRNFKSLSLALALGAGVLSAALWTGSAEASQNYPSAMQSALDMPCVPPCTICHVTDLGGAGTAIKPFVNALRGAGPVGPGNEAGLLQALANTKAASPPVDSDSDGTDDIAELTEGTDPNAKGEARVCGPAYGCGAHISRTPPARDGTALVIAGGMAALMVLGFRRVSPKRRQP